MLGFFQICFAWIPRIHLCIPLITVINANKEHLNGSQKLFELHSDGIGDKISNVLRELGSGHEFSAPIPLIARAQGGPCFQVGYPSAAVCEIIDFEASFPAESPRLDANTSLPTIMFSSLLLCTVGYSRLAVEGFISLKRYSSFFHMQLWIMKMVVEWLPLRRRIAMLCSSTAQDGNIYNS